MLPGKTASYDVREVNNFIKFVQEEQASIPVAIKLEVMGMERVGSRLLRQNGTYFMVLRGTVYPMNTQFYDSQREKNYTSMSV